MNEAEPDAAGRLLLELDPPDPVWEREMPGGSLAWTLLGTVNWSRPSSGTEEI